MIKKITLFFLILGVLGTGKMDARPFNDSFFAEFDKNAKELYKKAVEGMVEFNSMIDQLEQQKAPQDTKENDNDSEYDQEYSGEQNDSECFINIDHDEQKNLLTIEFHLPTITDKIDEIEIVPDTEKNLLTATIPTQDGSIITLSIQDNVLSFAMSKEQKEEEKSDDHFAYSSSYNSSSMIEDLPAFIDPDGTTAEYKEKTLTIIIPTKKAKNKITINQS